MAADNLNQINMSLRFWKKPDQVRTGNKAIAAGALELVPIVPLQNIVTKDGPSCIACTIGSTKFFIVTPPKPALEKMDAINEQDNMLIAAYWWVTTTNVRDDGNVYADVKEVKGGLSIPVYRNKAAISPFTQLQIYVPDKKAPRVASSFAPTVPEGQNEEGQKNEEGPKNKKAKTKAKAKAR